MMSLLALLMASGLSTASPLPSQAQSPPQATARRTLVVCADPNNLPFSNKAGEGFENKIAALVAKDLNADVSYVWWAQRRGYVRSTLNEEKCDLWPGVATGVDMVATTRPYYRSSYVFLSKADRPLGALSFDDPRLAKSTVGIQMVGDDAMNTPPAHAMARRGMTQNVRGFMLYGDYAKPNPPAAIIDAVAAGTIDVGVVWGPLAGYFAARAKTPLRIEQVTPVNDDGQWPMVFDISMGVRRKDKVLLGEVDAVLARESPEIARILKSYGVPIATPVQQTMSSTRAETPS
ncbi:quinoprotein dehydrogenase-associated putative ABC transporter substrate-binding protein [Sphingomonas sp. CFBP 13603]|uniref:quinoprotein dehydrogenase-associated putative ABC transporter substrate-binding protein n=1 Tax=Sphingomonas sp. CFBP 13603 TaxID=2774040 RepID=UPI0018690E71|nr:quinoprotein dehydrogenase-associated putative ABC transporter substrate-binding protein [Sphingomonas sp. CFBP 13603]MBE2992287.1 quinoprotein dehydrogenase-associated putative ABC transporter substrate-binding protein [Sphingomonas sp. CFBP 13603]